MSRLRYKLSPAAEKALQGQPLEVASWSSRHLLLTLAGDEHPVTMVGLLSDQGIPDLLSFCNMFRKTGVLSFRLAGGEKAIYFQHGEVVFATSTFPEEDLGEVLFNLGKVDRTTLDQARQFASTRTTLGRILVDKQVVSPKDLWQATRVQVEDIVYHLFAFDAGSYAFTPRPLEEDQIVRLALSTQNLIMEGLRRVDERGLFMRKIGSLAAVPVISAPLPETLAAAELRMAELISAGSMPVRELLRRSGLGEFDGLRIIYQLIEKRLVELTEPQATAVEGEFGEVLKIFNGAFTVLYKQVSACTPRFDEEIRYFLRDLPQPFSYVFREVELRSDGSVDGARILANLAGLGEGDKLRLLADALNELLFMECLAARRELGNQQSAELLQRVQEISRRIKDFIGRKA